MKSQNSNKFFFTSIILNGEHFSSTFYIVKPANLYYLFLIIFKKNIFLFNKYLILLLIFNLYMSILFINGYRLIFSIVII